MKYIDDWDRRRARHAAFWDGQLLDRCLCSVTAPKRGRVPDRSLPKDPGGRLRWWTDGDCVLERYTAKFEGTHFAGDSFPVLIHDLGPAGHAAFFKGCAPRFEGTVWFESDLKRYEDLVFDDQAFLYKKTLELARQYVSYAKGDFIVGMPDIVGDADALSHLRGPEAFMMDLAMQPEAVQEALRAVQRVWELTCGQMHEIVRENNGGGSSVGWLNTWAPGPHAQLQCDLSVMISPAMFEEFIRFELEAQSAFLANALYHLDGWQQVKHLDTILSVPGIAAVQWTNVVGQARPTEYIPELRRIQAAGKGVILEVEPAEVEPIMAQLSSRGLYLLAQTNTPADADALVRLIGRLTRD